MPVAVCPNCKNRFSVVANVKDLQCPKCGRELRVADKKATNESSEGKWWLRHVDGNVFGPYASTEIASFIGDSRIIRTAELKHPQLTHGQWLRADSVKQFAALFEKVVITPPPVADAPSQESPQAVDGLNDDLVGVLKAFPRKSLPSNTGFWAFIRDFIDPTFQRYLTPTIIWITWCTILFICGASLVVSLAGLVAWVFDLDLNAIVGSNENMGNAERSPFVVPRLIQRLSQAPVVITAQILSTFIFVLWVRVVLEVCIVLFHVVATLRAISESVSVLGTREAVR